MAEPSLEFLGEQVKRLQRDVSVLDRTLHRFLTETRSSITDVRYEVLKGFERIDIEMAEQFGDLVKLIEAQGAVLNKRIDDVSGLIAAAVKLIETQGAVLNKRIDGVVDLVETFQGEIRTEISMHRQATDAGFTSVLEAISKLGR